MPRVVHFEIHAADPQRAITFYETVFGWSFHQWAEGEWPYWLTTTGPDDQPGINGGLMIRRGEAPADGAAVNAYVCTMDVANVDEAVEAVTRAGGQIALPKMPVKGVGWLAYGKDPEGNLFGMMQNDPEAA